MRSLAIAATLLAACTSRGTSNPQPGDPVYSDDVVKVVLDDRGGGFAEPPPPGPCDPQIATYTATVASHQLAWTACDYVGSPPTTTTPRIGDRILGDAEWSSLEDALAAIDVVARTGGCGADKDMLALTVSTAQTSIEYADAFYECNNPGKPLVDTDALDHAMSVAGELAH
jgi:hypothetical protein